MRPTTAESTLRALIATVPNQRLRELVVELILTALRCLAARSSEPAVPTGNGRRRHWLSARRAAENATRRERRLTNADGAPKRRGRRPKANADAPGNGSEPTANGPSGVSPEALWEHAAKLEPKAPWRAIARKLGVAEAAAQAAQRDKILPCTPRAAARLMTL